ncbi:hypothetical protein [Amycolatopsis jiangsuensis]|uniref:DUF8083 domain-containing protein n=1 Tax=Amycolatopsis jiangsuensis TaxID=1181879 RepID=A0A840J0V2_9PSEU|nr:hypothetical protein [Amycolatopsis jiangsuensis]MBB4687563.1 hypothetical protein [Amycolatopsis jiangsuensis]
MLRPFAAYLRVYEPLAALADPPGQRLVEAVSAATLRRAAIGGREQCLWLKSQAARPVRLLPAELADGRAAPSLDTDVLVLDPAEVPTGHPVDGPLVCPLEMRARSAAALSTFLTDDESPAVRSVVLEAGGVTFDRARARTRAALTDLSTSAAHTLTTTWTVPLPWFALIDPNERKLVLGSGPDDPAREASWRTSMSDAVRRATDASELVEAAFGESGPGQVLAQTREWLDSFDPGSVVELDYGGLVQLFADPILDADTTAEEVHDILDALRSGNVEELAELFSELREFWGDLAAREHAN